jgi:hypothetical protein
MDYDYTTYQVEFTDEVKTSSPLTATRNTLNRLFREEIEAKVTTLSTGEVNYVRCARGEVIDVFGKGESDGNDKSDSQ